MLEVKEMSSEERRQREKDQRRELVIEVAFKLLCDGKFDEVTMDEIARKADLTKTTLYSYFKDKESILFAAINKGRDIYKNYLEEELEKDVNVSKLTGIRNARIKFIQEYPNFYKYFVFYRTKYSLLDDGILREEFKETRNFLQSCYEKEVFEYESEVQKGIYNPNMNPVVLFTLFLMLDNCLYDPYLQKVLTKFGMSTAEFYTQANRLLDDVSMKRYG
jgi:AcrR family transcriptional regulator